MNIYGNFVTITPMATCNACFNGDAFTGKSRIVAIECSRLLNRFIFGLSHENRRLTIIDNALVHRLIEVKQP